LRENYEALLPRKSDTIVEKAVPTRPDNIVQGGRAKKRKGGGPERRRNEGSVGTRVKASQSRTRGGTKSARESYFETKRSLLS